MKGISIIPRQTFRHLQTSLVPSRPRCVFQKPNRKPRGDLRQQVFHGLCGLFVGQGREELGRSLDLVAWKSWLATWKKHPLSNQICTPCLRSALSQDLHPLQKHPWLICPNNEISIGQCGEEGREVHTWPQRGRTKCEPSLYFLIQFILQYIMQVFLLPRSIFPKSAPKRTCPHSAFSRPEDPKVLHTTAHVDLSSHPRDVFG